MNLPQETCSLHSLQLRLFTALYTIKYVSATLRRPLSDAAILSTSLRYSNPAHTVAYVSILVSNTSSSPILRNRQKRCFHAELLITLHQIILYNVCQIFFTCN
jgi:hypothetical protein